ncbi:MAG: HD domain-containing protein [Candidatus Krumholzibacteriia bacterium]
MTPSTFETMADLLVRANRLKTTPRTGWAQRGVPAPESVADHSHGVAFIALALLDLVDEPDLDRATVLTMAIIHDLPESVTGDLSLGASRLLPKGAKAAAESAAMAELLGRSRVEARWRATWDGFEAQESPEARLVRDADRLDLLVQALAYERASGTLELEEFWSFAPEESFAFPASRALAAVLRSRRPVRS